MITRQQLLARLRALLFDMRHPHPHIEHPDGDWCTRCERVTLYDGEFCRRCGREWGHD